MHINIVNEQIYNWTSSTTSQKMSCCCSSKSALHSWKPHRQSFGQWWRWLLLVWDRPGHGARTSFGSQRLAWSLVFHQRPGSLRSEPPRLQVVWEIFGFEVGELTNWHEMVDNWATYQKRTCSALNILMFMNSRDQTQIGMESSMSMWYLTKLSRWTTFGRKMYGQTWGNISVCWVISCLKQLLRGPDVQKLVDIVAIATTRWIENLGTGKSCIKKESNTSPNNYLHLRGAQGLWISRRAPPSGMVWPFLFKSCSKHGNTLQIHQ